MKQRLTIITMFLALIFSASSCKRRYTCVCDGEVDGAMVETRDRFKAESTAEAEDKCSSDNPGLDCNVH